MFFIIIISLFLRFSLEIYEIPFGIYSKEKTRLIVNILLFIKNQQFESKAQTV